MSRILLSFLILLFATTVFSQKKGLLQKDIEQEVTKTVVKKYALFQKNNRTSNTTLEKNITDIVNLTLDKAALKEILTDKSPLISITIPLEENKTAEIILQKHDFLNSDFKIYESNGSTKTETAYIPGIYYKGVLHQDETTIAAFSFFENEIIGVFTNAEGENYNLVQTKNGSEGNSDYVLFKDKNILNNTATPHCEVDEAFEEMEDAKNHTNASRETYNNCKNVRVSVFADFRLFQMKNNSVTDVANYVTAIYNNLAVIYRNEGIIISIATINIATATDDYYNLTTATQMLNTFGANVQDSFSGDVAHLISGSPNNLGGQAWRDVLCQTSYPFTFNSINYYYARTAFSNVHGLTNVPSFPIYSWDIQVMAHEMGHNLGSRHTHSCTWIGGALDNCYTTEGGCPAGPAPTNGGTIMSYCYLNSSGVNFNNGFGTQPGDFIRTRVAAAACLTNYIPNQTLETTTVRTANRSCSDGIWTEYFFDNNTVDTTDDELLLSINTNSQNIGSLDGINFTVKVVETSGFGSNTAQNITAPYCNGATDWYVSHRYWQVIPETQPTNPVVLRVPFSNQDYLDVKGSIPALNSASQLRFFTFNGNAVANPEINHDNATTSDVAFYQNAAIAAPSTWQLGTNGSQQYAEFTIENGIFSGGFGISDSLLGVAENQSEGFYLFPNPTKGKFTVQSANQSIESVAIFDLTGKKVVDQKSNTGNFVLEVDVQMLQRGMYVVKITANEKTFTSKLIVE
jgi:metallopeptidase family M12-like protein/type IX secretion system substrate protein